MPLCDDRGFVLIDRSPLSDTALHEWANQVAIGLLAHGYAVCQRDNAHPAKNSITLDADTITVIYGSVETQREHTGSAHDDEASTGLAIAVATEELVLIATDPTAPKPPPRKRIAATERFRLGVDGAAIAYARTHVGYAAGLRYDLVLNDRFRLGAALAYQHVVSESSAAGRVRYNGIDAMLSAHVTALRAGPFGLVFGIAGAPGLVFARGIARDGYSGSSANHMVFTARALVDGELEVTKHQTLVLRGSFGRPLASFDARGDNGAEYGGLATWEARVALGWLWSFY